MQDVWRTVSVPFRSLWITPVGLAPLRVERRVVTFSRTRMRCCGCRRKVRMLTKTHSGSVTSDQRFVNDAPSTNSELVIVTAVSSSLSCYRPHHSALLYRLYGNDGSAGVVRERSPIWLTAVLYTPSFNHSEQVVRTVEVCLMPIIPIQNNPTRPSRYRDILRFQSLARLLTHNTSRLYFVGLSVPWTFCSLSHVYGRHSMPSSCIS